MYAVYVSFCVLCEYNEFVCVCGWVGRWVSMCGCGLNLKDFSHRGWCGLCVGVCVVCVVYMY